MYMEKESGGFWGGIKLFRQRQKRKRYIRGTDRRGHFSNKRRLSERPMQIEENKQEGLWESDTIIGTSHKAAVMTLIKSNSRYGVIAKLANKTLIWFAQPLLVSSSLNLPLLKCS